VLCAFVGEDVVGVGVFACVGLGVLAFVGAGVLAGVGFGREAGVGFDCDAGVALEFGCDAGEGVAREPGFEPGFELDVWPSATLQLNVTAAARILLEMRMVGSEVHEYMQ
jgi:hypothetical protein